jgi:hypothetical protein
MLNANRVSTGSSSLTTVEEGSHKPEGGRVSAAMQPEESTLRSEEE